MPDLLLAGRWALAIFLFVSGVTKLLRSSHRERLDAVERYELLPAAFVAPVALALPWLEITLAVSLSVGVMVVVGAGFAALLMGVFAAAVGWHVSRGHRFACGCGGGGMISWALAGRDLALCAVGVAIAIGPSGGLALWPGWAASPVSDAGVAMIPVPLLTVLLLAVARLIAAAGHGPRLLARSADRRVAA
jgi:uncharacterized membrane protein YphA (DoxX/SURF4 family)